MALGTTTLVIQLSCVQLIAHVKCIGAIRRKQRSEPHQEWHSLAENRWQISQCTQERCRIVREVMGDCVRSSRLCT